MRRASTALCLATTCLVTIWGCGAGDPTPSAGESSSSGSEASPSEASPSEASASEASASEASASEASGSEASASEASASEASTGDPSGSSTVADDTSASTDTSTGPAPVCPPPPAELQRWLVGDDADADTMPGGGIVMMGGGPDVDGAFEWWSGRLGGGDVVVLRTSGADGYNDYLLNDIGGADSVETLLVDTVALADDPYVTCRIAEAEGVFMAGGDQAQYMTLWKDHGVAEALMEASSRGAVIGGTSAGLAVLGGFVFAAYNDTVYSDEALEDPYNQYMTMDTGMLALPALVDVITDSHFAERDRMGRLVGFLARIVQDGWADEVLGIGVDEATALVVDEQGSAGVIGEGSVYVLRSAGPPAVCVAGEPLTYTGLELVRLDEGNTIALPGGATDVVGTPLGADVGVLEPADPY